jgi:epoxyqueuosine reductase
LVEKIDVKEKAMRIGFSAVGILSLEQLSKLPVGDVEGVHMLVPAREELQSVKSVIILGYNIWDPIFNVHTLDPRWRGIGLHDPGEKFEFHQLYSEVVGRKAWQLTEWLREYGYEAVLASGLPLKPAAQLAGLGIQGKNTILISDMYGPNLRLGAVLTSADLEPDEPFMLDLCGNCTRCIRACPTGALKPHEVNIKRCMVYGLESPESSDVDAEVRAMTDKLTIRPTTRSFIECTRCLDACPIGRDINSGKPTQA